MQVKSLLQFAASEFDVYEKSHIFPVEAYRLLVLNVRAYLSSLMMLLYPLQVRQEPYARASLTAVRRTDCSPVVPAALLWN